MNLSIAAGSVIVAGVALISAPLSAWLITRQQLIHNQRMQELRFAHEQILKLIELEYESDRTWSSLLRERIAALVAVAADIFSAQGVAEAKDIGRTFSNAQAQIEILVSSDEASHCRLRQLISDLSSILRDQDLKSDVTVKAVGQKRREIVDLTRDIVESTCSRNYSHLHLHSQQ